MSFPVDKSPSRRRIVQQRPRRIYLRYSRFPKPKWRNSLRSGKGSRKRHRKRPFGCATFVSPNGCQLSATTKWRPRTVVSRPACTPYRPKKHELPTTALYLGLKEIPRKRDGVLEDWIGWNRLLVGDDRTYGGGWFIPSLASKRSAPEGKHLLEAVYGGPASYGNGKKALDT